MSDGLSDAHRMEREENEREEREGQLKNFHPQFDYDLGDMVRAVNAYLYIREEYLGMSQTYVAKFPDREKAKLTELKNRKRALLMHVKGIYAKLEESKF